jgi:hypothetical protein
MMFEEERIMIIDILHCLFKNNYYTIRQKEIIAQIVLLISSVIVIMIMSILHIYH